MVGSVDGERKRGIGRRDSRSQGIQFVVSKSLTINFTELWHSTRLSASPSLLALSSGSNWHPTQAHEQIEPPEVPPSPHSEPASPVRGGASCGMEGVGEDEGQGDGAGRCGIDDSVQRLV
jgi:hypothetical protein